MNRYFKPIFSGFLLKIISTILFIAGRVMLELDFEKAGVIYKTGNVLFYIALPIIFFLAIEGYRHTADVRRYILRLLTVGAVGELIIDFALFGTDFSRYISGNNMNLFISVALGIIMIYGMDRIRKSFSDSPVWRNVLTILIIIVMTFVEVAIGAEQGGMTILTMSAMYLFYGNPFAVLIAAAVIQIVILGSAAAPIMYAPVIGVLFTWFYSGKRGYMSVASRALFYSVYPIAYVIVTMIIKARG